MNNAKRNSDHQISILDPTGVETMYAGRDASWLVAVSAQVDADIEIDLRRHDIACAALTAAVAEMCGAA